MNAEFEGLPYVPLKIGSMTAIRAFKVDRLGRLRSPVYGNQSTIFRPGQNTAMCMGDVHRPGASNCSCGFWAYWDPQEPNIYMGAPDNSVEGVIRATGMMSIGTKGLRTEKLEVLALHIKDPAANKVKSMFPPFQLLWRFIEKTGSESEWPWLIVALLCSAVSIPVGLVDQLWAYIVFPILMLGWVLGLCCFLSFRSRTYWCGKAKAISWEPLVRRNYPEVKIFRTRKGMLRAFPLSEPPREFPTPEDKDFWTRTS